MATREYVGPPVVGLVSMAGCPLSLWVVVACGGATSIGLGKRGRPLHVAFTLASTASAGQREGDAKGTRGNALVD